MEAELQGGRRGERLVRRRMEGVGLQAIQRARQIVAVDVLAGRDRHAAMADRPAVFADRRSGGDGPQGDLVTGRHDADRHYPLGDGVARRERLQRHGDVVAASDARRRPAVSRRVLDPPDRSAALRPGQGPADHQSARSHRSGMVRDRRAVLGRRQPAAGAGPLSLPHAPQPGYAARAARRCFTRRGPAGRPAGSLAVAGRKHAPVPQPQPAAAPGLWPRQGSRHSSVHRLCPRPKAPSRPVRRRPAAEPYCLHPR